MLSYNELIPVAKVIQHLKGDVNAEQFLFQNLPNTYTLTKHFAEKLVYHQAFFMPSGIFRPGIGEYFMMLCSLNFLMGFYFIIQSYRITKTFLVIQIMLMVQLEQSCGLCGVTFTVSMEMSQNVQISCLQITVLMLSQPQHGIFMRSMIISH